MSEYYDATAATASAREENSRKDTEDENSSMLLLFQREIRVKEMAHHVLCDAQSAFRASSGGVQ